MSVAIVIKPAKVTAHPTGKPDDLVVRTGKFVAVAFEDESDAEAYNSLTRNVPRMNGQGDFQGGKPAIIEMMTLAEYAELSGHPELVKQIADTKKANLKAVADAKKEEAAKKAVERAEREASEHRRLVDERKAEILRERAAKVEADALKQAQKEIDAIKAANSGA